MKLIIFTKNASKLLSSYRLKQENREERTHLYIETNYFLRQIGDKYQTHQNTIKIRERLITKCFLNGPLALSGHRPSIFACFIVENLLFVTLNGLARTPSPLNGQRPLKKHFMLLDVPLAITDKKGTNERTDGQKNGRVDRPASEQTDEKQSAHCP